MISKHSNEKALKELFKEFFHQAEFILNKEGKIVVATKNPQEVKEASKGFLVEDEREVFQGQEKLTLLVFNKE